MGFWRIFEDFGLPIGLPFPHIFFKNEGQKRKPKKIYMIFHGTVAEHAQPGWGGGGFLTGDP